LATILKGLKDHEALRTLILSVERDAYGPHFPLLRDLLSTNRNLTVRNAKGKLYSDVAVIDALYSLNRFFQGSAGLVVEPSSHRFSLVMATLVESALNDFQRFALLLCDHPDVLYELLQHADLSDFLDAAVPLLLDQG
jgi:hypothetical protein